LPLLSRPILRIDPLGSRRLGKRLFASVPLSVAQRNNVAMVALALILLVFGAVIPANAAGIFITGAVAMAVTILALLLLRLGVRRARERRTRLKELEASDETTSPTETSTTTTTTKTKPALDVERESSTRPAERQAVLDEADELTREEPQK
jgi:flagellar biosynthesis/type III secretory pathway M-ring protein FliF/YscJ